jgi:hypothetical protein
MRVLLSWLLYHIGDKYSIFMLKTGIGYKFYSKVMLLSCDLDKKGQIWKEPNE